MPCIIQCIVIYTCLKNHLEWKCVLSWNNLYLQLLQECLADRTLGLCKQSSNNGIYRPDCICLTSTELDKNFKHIKPIKPPIVSFEQETCPHCLVLVGSRNRFERDLKKFLFCIMYFFSQHCIFSENQNMYMYYYYFKQPKQSVNGYQI